MMREVRLVLRVHGNAGMTMISTTDTEYRREIEGLRAIAVLCVVFYHLGFPAIKGGFIGVDVFFVISGFLITRMLTKQIEKSGRIDLFGFYVGRVRRLFPALFVTIVISFIAGFFIMGPSDFARFSGAAVHSLLWVSNFFFWAESGYFDATAATKPALHTWSLSVEEQFYLFWPFLLLFAYRFRSAAAATIIVAGIGALSLLGNYLMFLPAAETVQKLGNPLRHFLENPASSIFFLMPFRIFEFAIGAVCLWFVEHVRGVPILGKPRS